MMFHQMLIAKPIGYEIVKGADNRSQHLKELSINHKIEYDYLCSIEGGYEEDVNGLLFVVSYCIVEDKNGKKSTGKSLGLRITKKMFEYIKEGHSLNKVIEKLNDQLNNKQNGGLTGYLTDGLLSREKVDKDAVISSFISFIYKQQKDLLNNELDIKKTNRK